MGLTLGPTYETLQALALTLGLGLLVGLERQRAGKEIGLRTFSFTALAGFLSWELGVAFAAVTLAFVAIVVVVLNIHSLYRGSGAELTTSVALLLTTLVGILVGRGEIFTGVAVTLLMLGLLSWKEEMVLFSTHLTRTEVHAAITLGLLAFVILPVLPRGPVDPWGLLVPRQAWLMVVLISAIGFGNYVLLRLYGARSLAYAGFLGGLVNSTATVAELAQKAQLDEQMSLYALRGILWAKAAMFIRNGLILALFAPAALPGGAVPVTLMLAVTVGVALLSRGQNMPPPPSSDLRLVSPFSLRSALEFGAIFAGLTALGGVARHFAGELGFYAVSFAGGLVSSASTTATAANLVNVGQITPSVAGSAVILTSVASALVDIPLVWRQMGWRHPLMWRVGVATALMIVAAAVGLSLNPLVMSQWQAWWPAS